MKFWSMHNKKLCLSVFIFVLILALAELHIKSKPPCFCGTKFEFKNFFSHEPFSRQLPLTTQKLIAFLNDHAALNFSYGQQFQNNMHLFQRLIEGAYPITYREDAKYLLLLQSEFTPTNCKEVQVIDEVKIASCT